jgi:exo-beta-1,3-glucanase (GH17 family)
MEDNQALSHIKNLTVKEEVLYTKENQMDDDIKHLHKVRSELEQCENPDRAEIRPVDTINNNKIEWNS